ncbi:MAG: 1,4-dihydroxy-2-naphthoate polyprenyltransferase [Thermomicrobiales bacterium]|nr:1,4-dihydroxy-2-naphthoate polyprenyltransferase [Thermomicrobiales bacterium]
MSIHAAERPSTLEIWYLAARPKTLPAAVAPIVVGTAVAIHEDGFVWWIALLALVTALLLQIAANFANDAIDAKKGSDTADRSGPMRITAAGLVTYQQVMNATWITLGLAMITGIPLLVHGGWPFVALGVASLVCAVAYTGGPFPISYLGLGEVFVFLFFGLIAVTGTSYLQTGELTALSLAAAIPPGTMIVGILIINNYRDREQDAAVHKRTVAVRIGARNTRIEYYAMLVITAISPFVFWAIGWLNWSALLTLLAWPMLWQLVQQVRTLQGPALNRTLGHTGKTALAFSVLLAAALIISA